MPDISAITNAAKNFACTLYKNQPGALVPTPASDLLHQLWDGFCGGDNPHAGGLPSPLAPPFLGGQCTNVLYDVSYTLFQGSSSTDGYIPLNTGIQIFGKIGSTFSEQSNDVNWQLGFYCQGTVSSGIKPFPFRVQPNNSGLTKDKLVPYIRINSIVRSNGAADTCGNPPPSFPPVGQPPPGGFTSPPVAITYNDNSVKNYFFNLKPPTALPSPASIFPPIVINYFNASLNPEFNIPITFNFDGTVNFGTPAAPTGGFTEGDRTSITNLGDTVNTINSTATNTNTIVNNFNATYQIDRNRNRNKPPLPTDFDAPKPPVLPGVHLEARLAFVTVTLTVVPSNKKSQSGKGAPDIIYAGWLEFRRAGKCFPREPIHFVDNCFIAPSGADGYAFTLYNGYQGNAVAVINKE